MKTSGKGAGRRSWWQGMGAWLYGAVRKKGWSRRILFAAAVILALLAVRLLCTASAYRKDPASLVPRTVALFIESQQIGPALRSVGAWSLWNAERREDGPDGWNSLQAEVMAFLNGQVAGLSTRPRKWLSSPIRGAFASGRQDAESRESWGFYFYLENPAEVVADLQGEPGVLMEAVASARNSNHGVYRMRDEKGGSLVLGVVGPWLIVSSDEWLPDYALKIWSKPSAALAGSGMLPKWGRASVRGLFDPARRTFQVGAGATSIMTAWLADGVRVGFTCRIHNDSRIETNLHTVPFTSASRTSIFWPIAVLLLWILVIVCVAVILAILLTVIGLGGWFKFLAIRAGVHPAKGPVAVTPSPAFHEDAGLDSPPLPDTIMQVDRDAAEDTPPSVQPSQGGEGIVTAEAMLEDNPDDGTESPTRS